MASPIVGALYFGLLSGGAGPGLPVQDISVLPQATQCIECRRAQTIAVRAIDSRFLIVTGERYRERMLRASLERRDVLPVESLDGVEGQAHGIALLAEN